MFDFLHFLGRRKGRAEEVPVGILFRTFRELLAYNNQALELIADMGEKLGGEYLFDKRYIETCVEQLEEVVYKFVYSLNLMTQRQYLALFDVYERAKGEIRDEFAPRTGTGAGDCGYLLPVLTREMSNLAGEKMATLGELHSRLGLPIPPGFVITTCAFRKLIEANRLEEWLQPLSHPDIRLDEAQRCGEELRHRILQAEIPREVHREVRRMLKQVRRSGQLKWAVRSSAVGEDTAISYAGQYETVLNVPAADILPAWLKVIASLFSADVIAYRRDRSAEHNPIAMAVGCTPMIDVAASGVLYTTDPAGTGSKGMVLTAAWGLGKMVVEGEGEVDRFEVSRDPPHAVIRRHIGRKASQYLSSRDRGVALVPVPPEIQEEPCLTPAQIQAVAAGALRIEQFMKSFQDIEWAVDRSGRVIYLQARPLRLSGGVAPDRGRLLAAVKNYPVLLRGEGMIASRGVGSGTVYHVETEEEGRNFPRGAVLVLKRTSPRLSRIAAQAGAVVTDLGAVTGHMATVCREFRVPTIVGTGVATRVLEPGTEVTVDAEENVIYRGIVRELLTAQLIEKTPYEETFEFKLLRRILKRVSALHVTDPQASEFDAAHCRTFHDIIRFGHEMAVRKIAEGVHPSQLENTRAPVKLKLTIPLDLTVADVGGGLADVGSEREISLDQVRCAPLQVMLQELVAPGGWQSEPVDLDLKGFMSSFTTTPALQTLAGSRARVNLAIVTREYVNLNLGLGYHFNMVDGNLSDSLEDNYAYFRFFGGVTEMTRRTRRARLLAQILEQSDFAVESKGDLVIARIKKIERGPMEEKFRLMGRLIGYTRQLDVLLRSENDVDVFAERFLKGETGAAGVTP